MRTYKVTDENFDTSTIIEAEDALGAKREFFEERITIHEVNWDMQFDPNATTISTDSFDRDAMVEDIAEHLSGYLTTNNISVRLACNLVQGTRTANQIDSENEEDFIAEYCDRFLEVEELRYTRRGDHLLTEPLTSLQVITLADLLLREQVVPFTIERDSDSNVGDSNMRFAVVLPMECEQDIESYLSMMDRQMACIEPLLKVTASTLEAAVAEHCDPASTDDKRTV